MLSIFAPHFFNWTEQLKDSGHEVYWLDLYDSNTHVKQIDFAEQVIGWRYKWDYPGRYFLKSKAPGITRLINIFNERNFQKQLEKQIRSIKPDVVHSFVMSQACVPIYDIMKANPDIKWLYSSWGSDLYYYENKGIPGKNIKKVLPRMDFMFSDCKRDYEIARRNGFTGEFLGVFPGGGGYDFDSFDNLIKPIKERDIILIKGYQGKHGRCIEVLKSIQKLGSLPEKIKIVVFGADPEVLEFVSQTQLWFKNKLEIYGRISHFQVMELMGMASIYIGNSSSDGMPNTLLEAIIMGAFPIQSNPGGATAEIVNHDKNGFLIANPEDPEEISDLLIKALNRPEQIKTAIRSNRERIKPLLERDYVRKQVVNQYKILEERL